MSKPILAVDIDEPVVSTGSMWMRYLMSHFTLKPEYRLLLPSPLPYNLTDLFILPEDCNKFEYFDYYALYDNAEPREDILEVLPKLAKSWDIIFVSRIMGNHFCSKVRLVDKYFPFHKGVYGTTKTKSHIKCGIFVDDCISNLNEMWQRNPDTKCIRFRSDYVEDNVNPLATYPIYYNWYQIEDYLGKMVIFNSNDRRYETCP